MPDLEDVRDLWEIDLELAGSDQGPIPIISSPPEKTWFWSDLHFGDRSALYAFQRPFGNVDQMNRHLLREWRRRVRSDDTIICLGDIAHPDAWRDRRLVLDIRDCPGKRVLVLGNHDLNREALREAGFATQCSLALCATDPPLALSHYPLRQIPVGAINLHGHLHEGTEPTARHINLAVEQTTFFHSIGLTCRSSSESKGKSGAAAIPGLPVDDAGEDQGQTRARVHPRQRAPRMPRTGGRPRGKAVSRQHRLAAESIPKTAPLGMGRSRDVDHAEISRRRRRRPPRAPREGRRAPPRAHPGRLCRPVPPRAGARLGSTSARTLLTQRPA